MELGKRAVPDGKEVMYILTYRHVSKDNECFVPEICGVFALARIGRLSGSWLLHVLDSLPMHIVFILDSIDRNVSVPACAIIPIK